ncbi:MAG: sarcosine oxidase subunit delta [Pirellulales bacterium]
MSFQITCPECGLRPVWEFHYGGPVLDPPPADPDEKAWGKYLYDKPNICGQQHEWWCHRSACKTWFTLHRDTRTNKVVQNTEG